MNLIEELRLLLKLEYDDSSKDTQLKAALNAGKSYIESYTGDIYFNKTTEYTAFIAAPTSSYIFPFTQNIVITNVEQKVNNEWVSVTFLTQKRGSLTYILCEFYEGCDYKFTFSGGYTDDNIPGEIKDILFDIALLAYTVKNDNRIGVTSNTTNLNGNIAQINYNNDLRQYETRLKKYRKVTV